MTATASASTIPTADTTIDEMAVDTNQNHMSLPKNVHVSNHPILSHKISILRSSTTHSGTFRAVLKELTYHLGYEATRTLTTVPINISVPLVTAKKSKAVTTTTTSTNASSEEEDQHADYIGSKLKERVALIPILRSGLGMVDSMMELIPTAEVHHIGMYKSSIQDHPVLYYNRLPRNCQADVAYILDPCIATASTIKSVVTIMKKVSSDSYYRIICCMFSNCILRFCCICCGICYCVVSIGLAVFEDIKKSYFLIHLLS
jgi:uracil phosphoribosyltransferase